MIKKYPKISVVMLNFNGLRYLKRTIPPILKLNYPNYEFIVVDNGSTDGSLEFIKNTKGVRLVKSPRFKEKNYACNYAIKRAKGEYILLLDNDLIINQSNILSSLIKGAISLDNFGSYNLAFVNEGEANSKNYGIFLGYYYVKENKSISIDKIKTLHNIVLSSLHGIGIFINKKLWDKLGGYDDNLKFGGDDIDLGLRNVLFGYKNYLYSRSLQTNIGIEERTNNHKYFIKWIKNLYGNLSTIVKNYGTFNLIVTLFIYTIFAFLKSVKQSIFRLHYGPLVGFFIGYFLFIKNLPYNMRKRKEIKSKRVISTDIFLKIRPPKIK